MAAPDIRPFETKPDRPQAAAGGADRGQRRALIALGTALVIALVLLVWSRAQLGGRIEDLRDTNASLEERNLLLVEQVARRDALIDAQK